MRISESVAIKKDRERIEFPKGFFEGSKLAKHISFPVTEGNGGDLACGTFFNIKHSYKILSVVMFSNTSR